MISIEDKKVKEQQEEEKAFNDFMCRPETKLLDSMIPPSENQEAVQTVLRSTFHAGMGHGMGSVLGTLLESIFKRPKNERF